VANRCDIRLSRLMRLDLGMMTSLVGFSWSDSSRRSLTMGSFFFCIWAAICSSILAPDTWCGSAVMTTSLFSMW